MSDADTPLRSALADSYNLLLERLRRRLRSRELAQEVLHDTYVRLGRVKDSQAVQKPAGFIMRVAINVARDRARAEKFRGTAGTDDTIAKLAEEAADPERHAEARSDLKVVSRALRRLPARRRAILLAACLEELSPADLGKRFGLSVRSINLELQLAREFCAAQIAADENN